MPYYIVSNSKLPDVLSPEIPKFYSSMSRERKMQYIRNKYWGDMETPRISLFNSIDDAIQGSFLYRAGYGMNHEEKDWYVYEAFMVQQDKVRKPSKEEEPLVQKVPVLWYTGNTRLKLKGKIQVHLVNVGEKQEGFPLTDKSVYSSEIPTLWLVKTNWTWTSKENE